MAAPLAQQLSPLPGYEQLWGTKKVFIGELVGPKSYVGGGQTVNASQLGWGGFDRVGMMSLSYSGTFSFRTQILPVDAAPTAFNPNVKSVKIIWIVVATGAEVAGAVDLSAEVGRFEAIGV